MVGLRVRAALRIPVAGRSHWAAVCLVVGLVAACGGQTQEPRASDDAVQTVEQAYALAERSLGESGVYAGTLETTGEGDASVARLSIKIHVDARRDLVRQTASWVRAGEDASHDSTMIVAGGVRWTDGRPLSSWKCPWGSASVGALLGCPDPSESSKTRVEHATRDGRPVIVLVTTGTRSGSDSSTEFTTRTFLDPHSALPLAREEQGITNSGRIERFRMLTEFHHEFVSADTLPAGFFDPESLGWRDDPEAKLPEGVRVYWLGSQFDPGGGLPPVVLAGSEPGGGPGYAAILKYATASDRHGPTVLTLQLWSREAWDVAGAEDVFGQCPGRAPITLPQGEGRFVCLVAPPGTTIPAGPMDPLAALVRFHDAVVVVDSPGYGSSASGAVASPYGTEEAMIRVLAALRVR